MTGHRRSSLVVIAALGLFGFAVTPAAGATAITDYHYIPGTALIDGDSVTTADGLNDLNGQLISEEAYIAEKAGFTPTVVSGSTWDSMTVGQLSSYQLLIVGDPDCGTTPTSATSNAHAWGQVVRSTLGLNGFAGNRVVVGTDLESALLHGGGAAQPSGPPGANLYPPEPIDPMLSGSGRLMANMMRYAGAVPDATGIYFAFPRPFNALIEFFTVNGVDTPASQTIDDAIAWLVRLHFGRAYGVGMKVAWAILGLTPIALCITGVLMWWHRVVRPSLRRHGSPAP